MALDRIQISDFRNHAQSELLGTAHFNLLVGENGAGKTNVLEAISLFAPGRGLRRAPLGEMARNASTGSFGISAELAALDAPEDSEAVRLGTGTRPDKPNRRIVHVNGAQASALSLGEWLSIGWLTPAQDRLFTDSAGARRRQMDRMALALFPAHSSHASRYESALRERNRLLSGEFAPDPQWMDSIEAQMAEAGAALASGRAAMVEGLQASLASEAEGPFARPVLSYVPGGPIDAAQLADALAAGRSKDRAAGRTLTGPHRDELDVVMAGKGSPAAQCSTGEQKAILVAMTLAHARLAADGRPALLLLDEIAAHLDPVRRAALFERLREGRAQIWMTGTERAPFDDIEGEAAVWRVSGGSVEQLS